MGKYKGFTQVKLAKPERSRFDLSHEKKLSTRMGKLVPIMVAEVIPNDTFKINSEVMVRLAPMLAPIYHRVNVFVHHFFVPNRLLWKDWEKFITGGRLGTETPPVPPYFNISGMLGMNFGYLEKGQLHDYLGLPPIPDADSALWANKELQAMPSLAYARVWHDYYRDRNYDFDWDGSFLPDLNWPFPSGELPDTTWDYLTVVYQRAWAHDYFTSSLPWTQRGDEVLMPFDAVPTYMDNSLVYTSTGGVPSAGDLRTDGTDNQLIVGAGSVLGRLENIAEISNSTTSINDFRRALRLQEWLERNALAGSRYNESIMAHFARKTSDGRLQRAEYLGGGRVPLGISEVMTTAYSQDDAAATVPPANPAGRSVSYANNNFVRRNFEEHGFVVSIMSIMPNAVYPQGAPRMLFGRQTFLDYPWPSFAHLGEQPVWDYELYLTPASLPNAGGDPPSNAVFGYQSRYSDWKQIPNTTHGDFRDTLDFWTLDRKFSSAPNLGVDFVYFEDALQDRIFAVAESDTCWCYVMNNVSVARSLPYFGTPTL